MEKEPQRYQANEKASLSEHILKLVPYEQIIEIVDGIKIEDGEEFELAGKTHQILYYDQDDGNPIEFYKSTQLDGFDIYIWTSLIKKYPKAAFRTALIHEIAEIALICKNEEENAHDLAVQYEKKYIEESGTLSKEEEELTKFLIENKIV